jgi:hypothetical protein
MLCIGVRELVRPTMEKKKKKKKKTKWADI